MEELKISDFTKDVKDEFNGLDFHKKLFINPHDKIEHQPIAISAGFNFDNYIPLVTYGNFACIVGASKSMKSFLKTALIACYIGGKSIDYFSDLRGHNNEDKYIIDLDTEQSEYHVHKSANRVLNMVGSDYEKYKMFALRSITPKERVQFLDCLFNDSEYKNKIGLCSIDGVADLIDNVNDLDKSNEITQKLMTLSADNNTAILTILHRNFETNKPTGHLGSAILKKAETVIFVDKNENIVDVKARYTRNIPFDNFQFELDDNALPKEIGKLF